MARRPIRPRSRGRQATARLVHAGLRRLGVDVVRLRHIDDFAARRQLALRGADVVVDVGANVGQFAVLVRGKGFAGRMVSFEPLPTAFDRLRERAAGDESWTCMAIALADRPGLSTLNVSRNRVSSSILQITTSESKEAPETSVVDRIEVQLATLDAIGAELFVPTERLFVKLDVQGAEARVLAGATKTLGRVVAVECELTILPLYEDQPLISDVAALLEKRGFRLVAIEPEYRDLRTGELKQVNGLFVAAS